MKLNLKKQFHILPNTSNDGGDSFTTPTTNVPIITIEDSDTPNDGGEPHMKHNTLYSELKSQRFQVIN